MWVTAKNGGRFTQLPPAQTRKAVGAYSIQILSRLQLTGRLHFIAATAKFKAALSTVEFRGGGDPCYMYLNEHMYVRCFRAGPGPQSLFLSLARITVRENDVCNGFG